MSKLPSQNHLHENMSEYHKLGLDLAWKTGQTGTLKDKKNGALVLCHEDIMDIPFGLMMNNWAHLEISQSGLLRILQLETLTEK